MASKGRQTTPPSKDPAYFTNHRFLLRTNWELEDILCGLQIGIAHFLMVFFTYTFVPENYMDEIFHIQQVRRYCKGDFRWQSKLTTPPLLYVVGLPFCRFGMERYVNSVLIVLFFIGCCRFRRLFTRSTIKLTSFTVCLLPVLLHSSALFYTDLLGACLVIWAFTFRTYLSAVFFFLSLLARQNNILWAGLYAVVRMYHHFDRTRPIPSLFKSTLKLWPFLLVAASFLAFLYWNNWTVVLGDPAAHQFKPHFAQILYLLAFCAVHAAPQALPCLGELISNCLSKPFAALCLVFFIIARYFTFDHPYLLADNRHVPFYLWRWFLKNENIRTALVPVYAAAAIFLFKMSSSIPRFVQFLFVCATIGTVVPAHLFEARYFIIPYVLWRLSASTSTIKCITFLEILLNFCIFFILFYTFLARPFEWVQEPGIKQRFMW